jgi:hypothetical protein
VSTSLAILVVDLENEVGLEMYVVGLDTCLEEDRG